MAKILDYYFAFLKGTRGGVHEGLGGHIPQRIAEENKAFQTQVGTTPVSPDKKVHKRYTLLTSKHQ